MASAMRALVAFLCISATFAIRGVNPADSSGYSQGQFACDDGKLTIDKSKVNDDFCDCKDGTDEPGTSACSNGKFYCANEGFQAKTVPSSRVNDGICDCCDASDEWEDESLCKDTCIEEAKEMYKEQLDQLDSIRKGVEAKRLLIEEGKKLRTEKEEKVSSSKSEKEGIEAEVKAAKELRDKLEEERKQAQANEEAEKGKEKKVEEEKVEVKETSPEQASEEVKEEKEEKFPYPKEYAAPSGDEEEPEKFPYPKEYAAPNAVEEEEEEEEEKFPYPKEYAAPNEEEEDEYPPEDLELDEENEEPSPKENDTGVQDSQELIDARQKVRDLESKVTTLNREISDAQKILDTVGLDDSLLALYGKCFTKQVKKYTYEVCLFESSAQKDGGSSTRLGSFSKFDPEKHEVSFEHGQSCWNGPMRSMKVTLKCGAANELTDVDEPSTCVYTSTLLTPAMCSEAKAEALEKLIGELSI